MRGRIALAAAVAALAAGAAAPAAGTGGDAAGELGRVGKRAFVVGDSLAVGTKPYLVRYLRGWRVGHSISISKHAPQGVGELARRGARGLPPVVVASLGTNDDPGAVSSFEHSIRTALRAVGRRGCVVWPNIVRPAVGGSTYAGYNAVLAKLGARRENLIVVNWARMVSRNRGWLAEDGVHVNATGYAARARAIAGAVRRCRQSIPDGGEKQRGRA